METLKKWALWLLVLSAALLLWGCCPGEPQNSSAFYVRIANETGQKLDQIHLEYAAGGEARGGGMMCHADGSPIEPDEQLCWEFLPEDFPENVDQPQIEIQFYLVTGNGTKRPAGDPITIPAACGNTYDVRLIGNSKGGYSAERVS